MIDVSAFFPQILPNVPSCPEPLAAQCVVDAAIMFSQDSNALKFEQDSQKTIGGLRSYDLDVPSSHTLNRVERVTFDGRDLVATVSRDVPQDSAVGSPTHFYVDDSDSSAQAIVLYPAPSEARDLRVSASLRPVRGATKLDSRFYQDWMEAIVLGALARIMAIPAQPFSDPARGAALSMLAVSASRRWRIESSLLKTRSSLRVSSRPFA